MVCYLSILTLAEDIKNWTHYQKFYFVGCFFLFFSVPTIGLQIFTLVFISKVTHGKDFNFSSRHLQYEILSFSFPRGCNGKADDLHVTTCSSEHDLRKRKNLTCVWSRCCRLEEEECIDSVLDIHIHGPLPWLSVLKFILVFVSKPKAKPKSTHVF